MQKHKKILICKYKEDIYLLKIYQMKNILWKMFLRKTRAKETVSSNKFMKLFFITWTLKQIVALK